MIKYYQNIRQILFVLFGAGAATVFWTDITVLIVFLFSVVVGAIGFNLHWTNYLEKNPDTAFTFRTLYDDRYKFKVRSVGIVALLGAIALFFQQGQFGFGKYIELFFGILTLAYVFTLKAGGIIIIRDQTIELTGLSRSIPLSEIKNFTIEADKITFQLSTHNIYIRECELSEVDIQKLKSFLDAAIK
jgi:hypothetical protein